MKTIIWLVAGVLIALDATAQSPESLKILTVVTGTERPLQVVLYSNRDIVKEGLMGGLIGGLIGEGIKKSEAAKLGETLNQTVPPFDRRPIVQNAIKTYVEKKYPVFQIVLAEENEKYLARNGVNYEQLKSDGYRFALVVEDLYTGLRAPNGYFTSNDSVFPAVGLKYELYDIDNKKQIEKNSREGHGMETKPMHEALADREFFVSKYPALVDIAVRGIVGLLSRSDMLNLMASRVGLGDKVPATGKVLASYEKQFDYALAEPKGWKNEKTTTKYRAVAAPKGADRAKFGVSYTVDLMTPELGQSVSNLDDYIAIFLGRIQESGYKTETFKEFAGLSTTKDYKQYVIDRPDGVGKEIFLFRMVDSTFLELFGVVFIDNYDKYFEKYKTDIETVINNTKLTIKADRSR